jgi:hypothetical protein
MPISEEVKSKVEKIKELKKQIDELEQQVKPLTRKIQKTPSGTFFVCLPKDWCKEHGLDKGSTVIISEQKDCLIIVP